MVFAFLGTPEIIIILIIALVVFGPQKLPEIGRQVGSALRELNKMRNDVQHAFELDTDYHRYDSTPYGNTYPSSYSPAALETQPVSHETHESPEVYGNEIAPAAVENIGTGATAAFVAPPGPAGVRVVEPTNHGYEASSEAMLVTQPTEPTTATIQTAATVKE